MSTNALGLKLVDLLSSGSPIGREVKNALLAALETAAVDLPKEAKEIRNDAEAVEALADSFDALGEIISRFEKELNQQGSKEDQALPGIFGFGSITQDIHRRKGSLERYKVDPEGLAKYVFESFSNGPLHLIFRAYSLFRAYYQSVPPGSVPSFEFLRSQVESTVNLCDSIFERAHVKFTQPPELLTQMSAEDLSRLSGGSPEYVPERGMLRHSSFKDQVQRTDQKGYNFFVDINAFEFEGTIAGKVWSCKARLVEYSLVYWWS